VLGINFDSSFGEETQILVGLVFMRQPKRTCPVIKISAPGLKTIYSDVWKKLPAQANLNHQ